MEPLPLEETNRRLLRELRDTNSRLTAALAQLSETQAQLVQAEKLSAIGQLVAGVAHELNNPLTSVIGYAQLLREELLAQGNAPRPAAEIAVDLENVCRESDRAARIVRNLLAFARRQGASREPRPIPELLDRVLELRTYELQVNDIEVSIEHQKDLPMVLCDGGQLQQVFLNLLLNAEQALRPTGRPRRIEVRVAFEPLACAVRITVSDNGPGIHRGHIGRVFDPFFTTRPVGEGTGLGLSICDGIVRDHGGEIEVDSIPGRKTTFTVRLPALPREPQEGRVRETVVACEDEATREYLKAAIAGWGLIVAAPETAGGAANALRNGASAVLADIASIDASFDQFCDALAAASARLIVLADDLSPDDGRASAFARAHACAALPRPFRLDALRAAVVAALEEMV